MDKTPAACAMSWGIHLEKSLRSKKPGKSIEALKEIGTWLEWWNNGSELTRAEYRMFGLIPGEDKLFLDAIFLRLVDTFRLGNKQIKNGIVKLFLRMKRGKKSEGEGILNKCKLENYLEVLSRVRKVFDSGDVEERALSLVLFGCWADFTKGCADIRYIVLSGLVSGDVLEVKAALLAAKCLSERSDDFANVFLEILTVIVSSPDVSRGVKLAGGRAFAKMCCSFSLAEKAYKTGVKLLMDSTDDDFSAVMLISLSRIASRWTLLISTQIELLTLFLSEERSLHMQATTLRCYRLILTRGVFNFASTTDTVHKLFSILHRSEFQQTLQDEALKILHKILVYNLTTIPCTEMSELFLKLSAAVKSILQSPIVSTRVLAISVLADFSGKFFERANTIPAGTGSTLACQAVTFDLDEILLLITPKIDVHQPDFPVERITKELMSLSSISSLSFVDSILQLDKFTVDRGMKMLGCKDFWSSYKAGKTAACQGAWYTAAYIFEQLMTKVKSGSSSCWLKTLAQFSNSEKQIRLFLLPDQSSAGEKGSVSLKINNCNYMENLLRACNTLLSAEEMLAGSNACLIFTFQRWFLSLRAKTLKSIVDMMRLLDVNSLERQSLLPCTNSDKLGSLICSSIEVSFRRNKLAREFDLLLSSFMGMDKQSVMSVSALALSCSLMAFTAGFAFLVPKLHPAEHYRLYKSGNSMENLHVLLIEDLVWRLRHIDSKTRKNLLFLMNFFESYKGCFCPRFQSQFLNTSYEGRFMHKLSEYFVGEIFSLQNEATMVQQDGDSLSKLLNNGSQLMLNVISKSMLVPFRTPNHFFRVRPALTAELFMMNEDGQNIERLFILSGSHLSLSLCLQLKNIPAGLSSPLRKVYCVLNCKLDSQVSTDTRKCIGQAQLSPHDKEIDDMMDLSEELMRYVIGSGEAHGPHCRGQGNGHSMVTEYVCFGLNQRGQGFSTCLLDVSCFPVGSYRVKWHCVCIDGEGLYWSLLPLNGSPLFTVRNVAAVQ